jgi:hypothetical protein
MAVDQEVLRHQETWESFTRLMKWAIAIVIIVLAGMALTLL